MEKEILKQLKSIDDKLGKLIELNTPLEAKIPESSEDSEYEPCEKCGDEFESYPFGNSHMCEECVQKEISDAEITKDKIRKELKTDNEFLNIKSQSLGLTYIKEKYKVENKTNKHLYLDSFARELINLKKLGKL